MDNTTATEVATQVEDKIDFSADIRVGQFEATVHRHNTGTHSLTFSEFGDRYMSVTFQLTAADFEALAKLLTRAVLS